MSLGLTAAVLSPPVLRGMKVLDKSAFLQRIPLWALRVPSKECSVYLKSLGRYGRDRHSNSNSLHLG